MCYNFFYIFVEVRTVKLTKTFRMCLVDGNDPLSEEFVSRLMEILCMPAAQ